jgi:hypothetical protein
MRIKNGRNFIRCTGKMFTGYNGQNLRTKNGLMD